MQIADRFHLHQNLLKAIKEALNAELPATIMIPNAAAAVAVNTSISETPIIEESKKNRINDGLSVAEKRRYDEIVKIQTLLAEGYAPVLIKELLCTTYFRIRRYARGGPYNMCRFTQGSPSSILDRFRSEIIDGLPCFK